ncbi:phosphoribosylglycinamide formyltransferase [Zymobacter palmae]|uniref:Phosphoribosylglycinamide formyltransferase n=1 Tax=Zymobacter palmae TaxID=33074 RepID=A0A348HDP7_9GAMM|nr:phosphoribosylglycinamide formyltransferase [Zymobacter palmae]BBG29749.1 phosphoribosylglycinamide formyltransferase [Zymobacter palmae]
MDDKTDSGFTPEQVPPRRIVALLSGEGNRLEALIEAQSHDELGGELVAVIADRTDTAGTEKAHAAGIDVAILPRDEYDTPTAYDGALIKTIERHAPDLVVLDGFWHIFSPIFTSRFNGRLLNCHPSLLPALVGRHTHQRALDEGLQEHGASVHFVIEGLNTGPLIIQAVAKVASDDTAETLAEKVLAREELIYPIAIRWFLEGRLKLGAQGAELDGILLPPTGLRLSNEDAEEELNGE